MAKNLARYYYAWELRQRGKKLDEIANILGFKSKDLARRMINYIDFQIKNVQNRKISNRLKSLINKYK